jgi:HEAT repeat protein
MQVHVSVQRLDGNQLDLQLDCGSTVRDLKQIIAAKWQVPALCQQLLISASFLNDHHRLAEFAPLAVEVDGSIQEHRAFSVAMVTSTVGLDQCLNSPCAKQRVAAIETIKQLGNKTTPEQLASVYAIIHADPDRPVREAAAAVLPHVVNEGDECAIAALSRSIIEDPETLVKQGSALALTHIAGKDNQTIVTSVYGLLKNPDAVVRRMGLVVLPRIVTRGDDRAVVLAKARLTDSCETVRFQAILALSHVANLGDEHAVSLVCEQLGAKSDFLRSQALATLPQMLQKSHKGALAIIKTKLRTDPALAIVLANITD